MPKNPYATDKPCAEAGCEARLRDRRATYCRSHASKRREEQHSRQAAPQQEGTMQYLKWIDFHRHGPRPVDLTKLSETARAIALAVDSTNYRHPRGTLRVQDRLTWEERGRRDGVVGGPAIQDDAWFARQREVFGDRHSDSRRIIEWAWLPYQERSGRWSETPEEYLERNARAIEAAEGEVWVDLRTPEERAIAEALATALFGGPSPEKRRQQERSWQERN